MRAPAAAAVFADARRRRLLLRFVGEGCSLAEVAKADGVSIGYLHYHARRWVALGLLEIVEERRRAGRPVKIYRAAGESFFVADASLAKPANAGVLDELYRGLEELRREDEGAGTLFSAEKGRPRMCRVDSTARPASAEIWRVIELDERGAAALAAELQRIAARMPERPSGPTRPYLVHLALAPRPRR